MRLCEGKIGQVKASSSCLLPAHSCENQPGQITLDDVVVGTSAPPKGPERGALPLLFAVSFAKAKPVHRVGAGGESADGFHLTSLTSVDLWGHRGAV